MKITIQKEDIYSKLADIQTICDKTQRMPILSHVLIRAEEEGSKLIATNLETSLIQPLTVTIIAAGSICLPAKKLFEIVKELTGDISIEIKEGNNVQIKCGKSKFKLTGMAPADFPVVTISDKKPDFVVNSAMLVDIITKTAYAIDDDPKKQPIYGSLLFHIKDKNDITAVATNGHRLAILENAIKSNFKTEKKIMITSHSVAALKKVLPVKAIDIQVFITKNNISFRGEDFELTSRLVEGTYPAYENVVPSDNKNILTIDRLLLTKGVRRVSLINKDSHAIRLELKPNSVTVIAINPQIGEGNEEIEAQYNGDPLSLSFNAEYLLNSLNALGSEKAVFSLGQALSPALMTESGGTDYKCVIMPMRN